jgi:hypothetical protein
VSYGLPPNWDETLKRLREMLSAVNTDAIKSIQRMTETALGGIVVARIQKQVADLALPTFESWQFQMPELPIPKIPDLGKQLADAARRWHEAFLAALPHNWRELGDENDALDIVEHIRKSKVCLVWLPRAAILREVLDAPATEAKAILLAHKDEVLDDALAVLGECQAADFALERDSTSEAIGALRAGHSRAAQALAACAFTSTCHVFFDHGGTGRIAKDMRQTDPEDAAVSQLRIRSIFLTSAEALEKFNPVGAKPAYRDFNRHNTVHRITTAQFSDANALAAIVLVTALLREVEEWPQETSEES